jgi:undecaprenyl diphosphate synthase
MKDLQHVAIILDGNGRWGLKKKKSRNYGHQQGLKTVENIVKYSIKKKIKFLTLYIFSTDNWKRPKKEIFFLFLLLENFLKKNIKKLHNENIKIRFIGSKKNLRKSIISQLNNAEKLTKFNKKIQINLAFNYGSKEEILDSVKIISKKKLVISKKNIESNLYTKNIPDPEILIRTGNTRRLSNFMLWQLSYTEIFFEKKCWPDFNSKDFDRIINKFISIKRNFGSIDEK